MIVLPTAVKIYLSVVAFLLGACIGSFVECAADRYVCGQSVFKGRSHCPACGKTLGIPDLIPIFSWLFLRGKCRHCGAKIPVSCLVAELFGGLGLLAIFLRFGVSFLSLELLFVAPILLAISLIDLKSMEIPNGLVIALIVLFAASIPVHFDSMLRYFLEGLIGAAIYGGGILLLSLIMDKIMKRETMGGGDIKLFFAVGLYLGPLRGLLMVILACFVGIVTFFLFRRSGGADEASAPVSEETETARPTEQTEESTTAAPTADTVGIAPETAETPADTAVPAVEETASSSAPAAETQHKEFPFGPAICLATFVCLLVGSDLVNLYLSLFA